jgi:hypothetical protein
MRRMADAEGGVAELNNEHGLGRARCRGTSRLHVYLLLGCTALNVKRLAGRADAASAQAAGRQTSQPDSDDAAADAITADRAAPSAPRDLLTARSPMLCSPAAAWTITLSLN